MQKLFRYAGITLGALIFSFGLNNLIIVNQLAEGGFVGISILGLYLFHVPLGLSFLLLNIPLFWLGYRSFGLSFILHTIVGVVLVSIFAELTRGWLPPIEDKLLAALYGGVVNGIGLGMIFRFGATTGGADIIARIVNHRWGWSVGRTLFMIDVAVILLVAAIIGPKVAMYSLVALFVAARVIDVVLEGFATSKALMIISDHSTKIADEIQTVLERGTTFLRAQGGFTQKDRLVLYVVVSREEVLRVQNIVRTIDSDAFVIVSDVHNVLGEGFAPLKGS